MTPSRSRDNFTALPALLLGTLAIAMMLPGAWNTFGTSLLLILVAVIGSLISLLVNLALWRWRRVLSVVAGLTVAVALVVSAQQLELGSRIRLLANKEFYLSEIAKDPASDSEPRFRLFDWGDFGGAGVANTFLTLIFDESGEIALPTDQRSDQWTRRVSKIASGSRQAALLGVQEDRRTVDIKRIEGPFYLMTETYQ